MDWPVRYRWEELAQSFLLDVLILMLEAHELDQMLKVAFALLDCQIDEVPVILLMKVSQKIRMQVDPLKQLNLELSDLLVLPQHALHGYLTSVQAAFEDAGAATALTD